jgi:hypothetical protein
MKWTTLWKGMMARGYIFCDAIVLCDSCPKPHPKNIIGMEKLGPIGDRFMLEIAGEPCPKRLWVGWMESGHMPLLSPPQTFQYQGLELKTFDEHPNGSKSKWSLNL